MQPGDAVVEVAGAALGRADEIAGTVVDAGEAAREWVGRRVVVPRILPCGDCEHCRRGRVAACAARRVRDDEPGRGEPGRTQAVPARWLTSVEPPLWPDGAELWQLAALADAALAPYTALSRAGVGPSDRVVILGNDARAQFAVAIVAAKGAKLVDANDATTPDGAVVLATSPGHWARALARVAPGVTIALLDGDAAPPPSIDVARLAAAEAHVLGVVGGHPDSLARAGRARRPRPGAARRRRPSHRRHRGRRCPRRLRHRRRPAAHRRRLSASGASCIRPRALEAALAAVDERTKLVLLDADGDDFALGGDAAPAELHALFRRRGLSARPRARHGARAARRAAGRNVARRARPQQDRGVAASRQPRGARRLPPALATARRRV